MVYLIKRLGYHLEKVFDQSVDLEKAFLHFLNFFGFNLKNFVVSRRSLSHIEE